jgi:hypothetical protein
MKKLTSAIFFQKKAVIFVSPERLLFVLFLLEFLLDIFVIVLYFKAIRKLKQSIKFALYFPFLYLMFWHCISEKLN